jgi:hypothetical protein
MLKRIDNIVIDTLFTLSRSLSNLLYSMKTPQILSNVIQSNVANLNFLSLQ